MKTIFIFLVILLAIFVIKGVFFAVFLFMVVLKYIIIAVILTWIVMYFEKLRKNK